MRPYAWGHDDLCQEHQISVVHSIPNGNEVTTPFLYLLLILQYMWCVTLFHVVDESEVVLIGVWMRSALVVKLILRWNDLSESGVKILSIYLTFHWFFSAVTSSLVWINLPIAILVLAALRRLSFEIEVRWKPRTGESPSQPLQHLHRRQLTNQDPLLAGPSQVASKRWICSCMDQKIGSHKLLSCSCFLNFFLWIKSCVVCTCWLKFCGVCL